MSTKANVLIVGGCDFPLSYLQGNNDNYIKCTFYKHLDGYPEHMIPLLKDIIINSRWEEEGILEKLNSDDEDFIPVDGVSSEVDYVYLINVEYESLEFIHTGGEWVEI